MFLLIKYTRFFGVIFSQKFKFMRLFFLFSFFCLFGFSQSNSTEVNQALNTAKANNINTKSDVKKALQQNGISESQARALARQKGVSYDEILNSNFSDAAVNQSDSSKDATVSDLEISADTDSEADDV